MKGDDYIPPSRLHVDFETYSEVNLKDQGLDIYAKHPSTEILMTAWALDDAPVKWSEGVPQEFFSDLLLAEEIHAFNAQFERTILREVAKVDLAVDNWRCTMVHAYHLSFSGTLDDIGKQLGLPEDKQKLRKGKSLIEKFCKPAPKNHKIRRYTKENRPNEWQEFKEYNVRDVITEREISRLLERYPMPQSEWELWFIDQRINDRGIPIDRELVEAGLRIFEEEKRELTKELKRMTGLDNPNSRDQMLNWVRDLGYPYDNLASETVEKSLKEDWWGTTKAYNDFAKDVLRIRRQAARAAGSKWQAFLDRTDWNSGRLRHTLQHNGASRTGRWGGRGVQIHNLHRSSKDHEEKIRSMLIW